MILVNSNPATIMTDPDLADATYIEPITPEWVDKVIENSRKSRDLLCRIALPLPPRNFIPLLPASVDQAFGGFKAL